MGSANAAVEVTMSSSAAPSRPPASAPTLGRFFIECDVAFRIHVFMVSSQGLMDSSRDLYFGRADHRVRELTFVLAIDMAWRGSSGSPTRGGLFELLAKIRELLFQGGDFLL